jgi:hypothetical protein
MEDDVSTTPRVIGPYTFSAKNGSHQLVIEGPLYADELIREAGGKRMKPVSERRRWTISPDRVESLICRLRDIVDPLFRWGGIDLDDHENRSADLPDRRKRLLPVP